MLCYPTNAPFPSEGRYRHMEPSSPPRDSYREGVAPAYFPPMDRGALHHNQLRYHHHQSPQQVHFQHHEHHHQLPHGPRRGAPCEPDAPLSLSQDELRRLLDAADYAQRERALLLHALEGLSLREARSASPTGHLPDSMGPDATFHVGSPPSTAPVYLKDEGGLFRMVPPERSSSPKADSHKPGNLSSQCHFPAEGSPEDYESDHFRMFRFKVEMCRESRCHDWAQCPFAHPGEKASRRDPRVYRYSAVPCPDVKRNGKCSRGDSCTMAHGVFECWLHPSRYRTQPCKDGARCPRKVCFFAHASEQLRLAPAAAAAAAADAAANAYIAQADGCLSLQRTSFDMAPPSLSPTKASSPSSVLSPTCSSPPPSPYRTTSLTAFSPRNPAALDFQRMSAGSPQFTQTSGMLPTAHLPELAPTSVPNAAPGTPVYAGTNFHVPRTASESRFHPAPPHRWSFDQAPSGGLTGYMVQRPVYEEEPDLKWVSDLIQ